FLGLQTIRTILRPIRTVTQSALSVGAGNLDQVVPVLSHDELGQLADAFNLMARQMRHYRQSQSERLLRAQQTSQAAIDSFPHPPVVGAGPAGAGRPTPPPRRPPAVAPPEHDGQSGAPPAPGWQPPEPLRQALAEALRDQRAYLPEGFAHAVGWNCSGQDRFF